MAFIEPRSTRIERIFSQNLITRLRRASGRLHPSNFPTCVALLQAGYAAAPGALAFEPLKTLWSDGDANKAARLAKVFTLAMLSRYLSLPRDGREEADGAPNPERRDWIDFLLGLFGDESASSLDLYERIDRQYQLDQKSEDRHLRSLADVLYFSQAMAALGGSSGTIDVKALPLQAYTQSTLVEQGIAFLTSGVHEALLALVTDIFYSTVLPRVEERL